MFAVVGVATNNQQDPSNEASGKGLTMVVGGHTNNGYCFNCLLLTNF